MNFDPKTYWENRLSGEFSIVGIGYNTLGMAFNKWLVRACEDNFIKIKEDFNLDLSNNSILDIGCGTGVYINLYLKNGASDVTGLDITKVSIENLKLKYPIAKFYNVDISDKNLKIKKNFDIISAFAVLYHIVDEKKFDQAIKNIRKLSKVGSKIIISDNFLKVNLDGTDHQKSRTLNRYRGILEKNGIKIIKIYPIYYFLNAPCDIKNPTIRIIFSISWK